MHTSDVENDVESLYAAICDLNGNLRGKRIPKGNVQKALEGQLRMPLSLASVDIWGADLEGAESVFGNGDLDGVCEPTGRGVIQQERSALVPLWLANEDGSPYLADPRRALADVCERFKAAGLTPVVATELEFYLMDGGSDTPQAPISPATGRHLSNTDVLSLAELEQFEAFLNDVYTAFEQQNIPADAAIAENGRGQFEVNLLHVDDPLKAADDAIFFKRTVKNLARQHGMIASFMAKPYGDQSGNGFHVHFSLLDEAGNNVFDDGGNWGTDTLRQAVAGLIQAMPDSMLVLAPHLNSYRRLQKGSHAPTVAAWGYENRTAAIRIPGGSHKARRIEHRVAGADANPYLVLACVLGSALYGIENKLTAPAPLAGSAYDAGLPSLPNQWSEAIQSFAESDVMAEVLNPLLCELFLTCKQQEFAAFSRHISEFEYHSYLEIV